MIQYHKIAVIGGTGKAGKYLVKNLLAQGFQIKILLRHPENFKIINPLIEVIKGDARDLTAIRILLEDCSAIISAVGQPKGEPSVFSQVSKNITEVMNEYGIKRYILLTGLNVDTPFDQKNEIVKQGTAWMYANYPLITADKQLEYEALVNSNIDWTLVRLPLIELTDKSYGVNINLKDCPGEKISATDLSYFLINQLHDQTYIKQAPFIASI